MVSQLLFGELCEILDQSGRDWYRIRVKFDGYEGWCQPAHLAEVNEADYESAGLALTPE